MLVAAGVDSSVLFGPLHKDLANHVLRTGNDCSHVFQHKRAGDGGEGLACCWG